MLLVSAACQLAKPKTVCGAAKPATACAPSCLKSSGNRDANSVEATTASPSLAATFSRRAARLTAGPMQVKSRRLPPPMLPYITSPTCSASPKRIGASFSPGGGNSAMRERNSRAQDRVRRQTASVSLSPAIGKIASKVAHEFEHLAAVIEDRRHLAAEIEVQAIDQSLRRQTLGKRGKRAHVR